MDGRPKVTVIIPAFNEQARIVTCLTALRKQTYPAAFFDIVVVDNNSTDNTADLVRELGVTCLHEPKRNAEAARNTGARNSSADILAFTDADCVPHPDWLTAAVEGLRAADLVAGHVQFSFADSQPQIWELYDAAFNLQHAQSVRERGLAFTANLVCWRRIYDELGGFPEDSFGGGDLIFTREATSKGKKLVFVQNARVTHPARRWRNLITKSLRIGREKGATWVKDQRESQPWHAGAAIGKPHFVAFSPRHLSERLSMQGEALSLGRYFLLNGCNVLYLICGAVGFVRGVIQSKFVENESRETGRGSCK